MDEVGNLVGVATLATLEIDSAFLTGIDAEGVWFRVAATCEIGPWILTPGFMDDRPGVSFLRKPGCLVLSGVGGEVIVVFLPVGGNLDCAPALMRAC